MRPCCRTVNAAGRAHVRDTVDLVASVVQSASARNLSSDRYSRFRSFAWFALIYNVFVVLVGAYVRASGSGAGCGSHWPLCNGQVIPHAPQIQTVIEFTHRITSGLSLLIVAALCIWAFRLFPARHRVRRLSIAAAAFLLAEALLGAGLVLFEFVAHNESVGPRVLPCGASGEYLVAACGAVVDCLVRTPGGRSASVARSTVVVLLGAAGGGFGQRHWRHRSVGRHASPGCFTRNRISPGLLGNSHVSGSLKDRAPIRRGSGRSAVCSHCGVRTRRHVPARHAQARRPGVWSPRPYSCVPGLSI